MSIALVQPLPVGTALRLFLEPAPGAQRWRVLRRSDDAFTGPDDPQAAVILDSAVDRVFVDATGLRNGITYHYRLYRYADGAWSPDGDATGVPAYSITGHSTDPLMLARDRLADGLNALIDAGTLPNPHGRIAVLTAPPVFDDTDWPVVTVHLSTDAATERGIGELIEPDSTPDEYGMVTESEGWLSNITLNVISWSLNPDERALLRHAIQTVVIANLPVFEAEGLQQVELSQDDSEDFTSYDAPVYQTTTTLRGLYPAWVSSQTPAVREVVMTLDPHPCQVRGFGKPYPPINRQFYR